MEKKLKNYFICMLFGAGIFAAVSALDDLATSKNEVILSIVQQLIGQAPGYFASKILTYSRAIITVAAIIVAFTAFTLARRVYAAKDERLELDNYFRLRMKNITDAIIEIEKKEAETSKKIDYICKRIDRVCEPLRVDSIDDL